MPIRKPFAVLPTPLGTITTGNEKSNRLAAFLNEFSDIGMVWQSTGNTNLFVRGNFGSAKPVDFVSMISANALPGTTIRVRLGSSQAAVDGTAEYDSGVLSFISPAIISVDGLYTSHLELPSVQTRQWWRIDIAGHTGDFSASSLCLGQRLDFATFYNNLGFEFGLEDMSEIDWGRYGVIEDIAGFKYRTLQMEFGWLTDTERSTKFQPLVRDLGKRGVAFWCFDPDPTVQRQDKSYWGWLRQPPSFKASTFKQDRWGAQFDIISMI